MSLRLDFLFVSGFSLPPRFEAFVRCVFFWWSIQCMLSRRKLSSVMEGKTYHFFCLEASRLSLSVDFTLSNYCLILFFKSLNVNLFLASPTMYQSPLPLTHARARLLVILRRRNLNSRFGNFIEQFFGCIHDYFAEYILKISHKLL